MFFEGAARPSVLSIPPSKDYIDEVQKCWANPKTLTHHTSASRALAAMQEAKSYGLGQMSEVDPCIANIDNCTYALVITDALLIQA